MARIQSNIPLIFDARKQSSGIIRVEITDWRYEVNNNRYSAVVTDFVIDQVNEDNVSFERQTQINSKIVIYPKSDIDALYLSLNNPIEITDSYSDELDKLISRALLQVTQDDPIYGSVANNWELI